MYAKWVVVLVSALLISVPVRAQTKTPDQVINILKSMKPGTEIDFEQTNTTESAAGAGASMTATGDKASAGIDATAPDAKLPGGVGATGGASKATGKAEQFQFNWLPILTWILAVGAGVMAVWQFKKGNVKAAVSYAGMGVALGAVAFFPAILPIAGIAGVGYLLVQSGVLGQIADTHKANASQAASISDHGAKEATQYREGLRAVAAGVDQFVKNNPDAGGKLLSVISAHADDADKDIIKSIRREDGLG